MVDNKITTILKIVGMLLVIIMNLAWFPENPNTQQLALIGFGNLFAIWMII